ncbi:hypothetical protein QCN27_09100 [Cereibacter sp. SYSU M97828]|nr:hypothetical protein [Cereibacter flavus]
MASEPTDLQYDVMREGMEAIRNISGALLAWDWKDDAERLAAIHLISEALYTFDARSEVALDASRPALTRLRDQHPEIVNMCPALSTWLATDGA